MEKKITFYTIQEWRKTHKNDLNEPIMKQLTQEEEDEKYREALRATCSLCILEGRCVCGELDPEEEEFDPFSEDEE